MNAYQAYLLERLRVGATELAEVVGHFPADRVDWSPAEGVWSLRELLHHVRVAEVRYLERLKGVLEHGQYTLPPFEMPPLSHDETVERILAQYQTVRQEEIDTLTGLNGDQWGYVFYHPTLWGDVTLEFWAERMVTHTAEHTADIWRLRQLAGVSPERRPGALEVV